METERQRAELARGAGFFRRRPSAVKPAVIYLASWLILLLGLDGNALNVCDEGIVLFGGLRVLGGREYTEVARFGRYEIAKRWEPQESRR